MARDLDKYRKYIDHFDLSEENKTALLEALWKITGSWTPRKTPPRIGGGMIHSP